MGLALAGSNPSHNGCCQMAQAKQQYNDHKTSAMARYIARRAVE
jgi:hypothetical protein